MKRCPKCNTAKETDLFRKSKKAKDGLQSWCIECQEAYKKSSRQKALHAIAERSAYHNKEGRKESQQAYKQSSSYKEWYRNYSREYLKQRRDADPVFRLVANIRSRHSQVLKGRMSTTEGLGCSSDFLREYIKSQWTEGMSWNNYGYGVDKWTIDHKLPLDMCHANPELLPQLIHYTNLQPMWLSDNIKKSNKKVG